jgi:hypothetical protein
MNNEKLTCIVDLLKQAKSNGLTSYQATQSLLQQGYLADEIEQASYQFRYSDASTLSVRGQSYDNGLINVSVESHTSDLEQAKHKVNRSFALSLIPFIGGFFRMRMLKDDVNYESIYTGYSKSTIFGLWVGVMIICAAFVFFAPVFLAHISFLKGRSMVLFPFAGVLLATVIFKVLFRKQ